MASPVTITILPPGPRDPELFFDKWGPWSYGGHLKTPLAMTRWGESVPSLNPDAHRTPRLRLGWDES